MDSVTIVIVLAIVALLCLATLLVFLGLGILVFVKLRNKPVVAESMMAAEPVVAVNQNIPPAPGADNLVGMFDDKGELTTKTELFQRGKMAIDWEDDEEDEAEATEIFSAHGAAGDLAEFAFDED